MTKLVFTVSAPVNSSYTLTLNSTVLWTLNTSGVAPVTYGPSEPEFPAYPELPRCLSDVLVILHQGHNSPCNVPDQDFDASVDWLNQVGYDVMNFNMPLFQANSIPGVACDHAWFAQWEAQGVPVYRFFIEPVIRAITYDNAGARLQQNSHDGARVGMDHDFG